jgi:peptide/nickel transport system permease protein
VSPSPLAPRSVARRLGDAALLLWIVCTLTFVLVRAAPGDPADLLIPPTATADDARRMRAELGLDAPVAEQYARWLAGLLRGDLGESFVHRRPVSAVIAGPLAVSLALGVGTLALTFVIGVAIGLAQAVTRGGWLDRGLTVVTTAVYAAPSFWLALALIAVFTWGAAVWGFPAALRLPAFGLRDPASEARGWAAAADVARHALLPVLVLTAVGAAGIARYARSSFLDVLGAGFVRTARAKGAAARGVYGRHALRNAIAPLVVLLALALPGVVAGSVFVETVFAWPGMGRLTVTSIAARDYPVVMATTVLYGALVVAANLAADLALPALDPRRR